MSMLLLGGVLLTATAVSFGLGIWCLARGAMGADYALLLAVSGLVGLPMGGAAIIVGAARTGRLDRWGKSDEEMAQAATRIRQPGMSGAERVEPGG